MKAGHANLNLNPFCIKPQIIHSKQEALAYFEHITSQGYEGIVLKSCDSIFIHGSCPWVKLKYKDQTDYPVSLIDPTKQRIKILNVSTAVGVKVADKDKANLKIGDLVTIEHQGVLVSGSLRHPVFKGKAKEVMPDK